ncbi:MAG: hypothetical protein IMW98_00160 [Firmicutes bacterium]|nr:hypothetical protein [Bacillota bacterium]
MKRVRREVEVRLSPEGVPVAYRDRGRWREIEAVVDCWFEVLPWWPGREAEMAGGRFAEALEVAMYRVLLEGGGLVELERCPARGGEARWRLYRVYD